MAPAVVVLVVLVIIYLATKTARAKGERTPKPRPPEGNDIEWSGQVPVFRVVALGLAGSGKTVFLASMFHGLSVQEISRSYFLETDVRQRVALGSLFRQVANVTEPWPRGTRVGETREFTFDISAFHEGTKHQVMRMSYLDYAGELLEFEQESGSTALAVLEERINTAHSLFGMLDGQRLLQCLRDEVAGLEYVHNSIQPMIGVMASASCPIQFIVTKWDMVHNFGEPEGADDNLRLKYVRRALMKNAQIEALVTTATRGSRVVRLIPVSAVGPSFAKMDSAGQVIKSGSAELNPTNLDVPLSTVLPDFFTKVRSQLDEPMRNAIDDQRKVMSQRTPSEIVGAIAKTLQVPTGIVLQSGLFGPLGAAAEGLASPFLEWMTRPLDEKTAAIRDAEDQSEMRLATVARIREEILKQFDYTLWQMEKQLPASILIDA
jgi:hypothetical protein